ncbi:MAG: hypothetical protein O3B47_02450, partial [bacterium]|nr:hypothetical protein [bacterium]
MPSKKKKEASPQKKDKIKKVQEEVKKDAGSEVSEKAEVVSAKKVVYIEIDDEVTAVYDRIKAIKGKHVYIVAPKRSILFQSVVNLKILKRKSEDDDRQIYLITNDRNGIHLAQKVGITVYSKADSDGRPGLFSSELDDDRLRITPLRASVNEIEDEAPTRLTERKISISEILRKRNGKTNVDVSKIVANEKKIKKAKSKFVIIAPNRHALIELVTVSLVILIFIVYIALPGATIYITPSASILEKSVNITLADFQKNKAELDTHPPKMIESYPISTTVSKTISYTSTGKKFSDYGANAGGIISIVNTSNNAWPLVAQTRFQTDDGIVFRILDGVTVPAASGNQPGKLDVFAVADQLDAYGGIVGEKGNIGPSRFFLPGLREDSRSKIYGESFANMEGGVTDYVTYITAEDLEASKIKIAESLKDAALEDLQESVKEKAELSGSEVVYSLLLGENAVKVGEPSINLDMSLEGNQLSEFTVSGEVVVSGVYYHRDAMLEILKSELLLKKSPQKELLRVNEDSTTYRIFEWDENAGKIKLTANIKGIEQFEIDENKENGARLLEKMKEYSVGSDIEEAK